MSVQFWENLGHTYIHVSLDNMLIDAAVLDYFKTFGNHYKGFYQMPHNSYAIVLNADEEWLKSKLDSLRDDKYVDKDESYYDEIEQWLMGEISGLDYLTDDEFESFLNSDERTELLQAIANNHRRAIRISPFRRSDVWEFNDTVNYKTLIMVDIIPNDPQIIERTVNRWKASNGFTNRQSDDDVPMTDDVPHVKF